MKSRIWRELYNKFALSETTKRFVKSGAIRSVSNPPPTQYTHTHTHLHSHDKHAIFHDITGHSLMMVSRFKHSSIYAEKFCSTATGDGYRIELFMSSFVQLSLQIVFKAT